MLGSGGMTSLDDGSEEISTRVDRLSNLPNELLEIIFDLVYARDRSTRPLSKRLLPHHERSLYRQLCFANLSRAPQLYRTLELHPWKGSLIKEIYAPLMEDDDQSAEFFDFLGSILPFCLELQVLDVLSGWDARPLVSSLSLWNVYAAESLHLLQDLPVKRLDMSLAQKNEEEEDDYCTDLDTLAILQEHPSVCELRISDWDHPSMEDIRKNRSFTLPGIRSLRVEGIAADEASVKAITELCPLLVHLHLVNTWNAGADYSNVLPHLPISLLSLALEARKPNDLLCDQHLSLLTSLRSIDLGDNLFSPSIHNVLQLPLLEKIRLGYGTIEPDGFSSLITGPFRLQHLRQLDLDLYPTIIGRRTAPVSSGGIAAFGFKEPGENDGWPQRPEHENLWPRIKKGLSALVEAGKQNRIVVNADISTFENYRQAWELESFNRSILFAFCRRSLQRMVAARLLARDCSWLPLQADLDSLDPERLELVETPVPELDWFVFSLRNKDTEVVQRDGEHGGG